MNQKGSKRIFALLVAMIFALTLAPAAVLAKDEGQTEQATVTDFTQTEGIKTAEDAPQAGVITDFKTLESDVAAQSGPASGDIAAQWTPALPDTLEVTLAPDDADHTVPGVSWHCTEAAPFEGEAPDSPGYDPARAGVYTFAPALPTGYTLAEGLTEADLPVVTVTLYLPRAKLQRNGTVTPVDPMTDDLQTVMNMAADGDILELTGNYQLNSTITLPADKSLTLCARENQGDAAVNPDPFYAIQFMQDNIDFIFGNGQQPHARKHHDRRGESCQFGIPFPNNCRRRLPHTGVWRPDTGLCGRGRWRWRRLLRGHLWHGQPAYGRRFRDSRLCG